MARMPKIPIILFTVFVLAVMVFGVSQFLKVRQVRNGGACYNRLRQIESAKSQWALEQGKGSNDVPTWSDLSNYISSRVFPDYSYTNGTLVGSNGDVYTIGRIDELPSCVINGTAFTLSN